MERRVSKKKKSGERRKLPTSIIIDSCTGLNFPSVLETGVTLDRATWYYYFFMPRFNESSMKEWRVGQPLNNMLS